MVQGVVVTAVTYCLQAWIIEKKGPVFLAMSTPFSLVITTVCSAILLGDSITLGRYYYLFTLLTVGLGGYIFYLGWIEFLKKRKIWVDL